MSTRNYLELSGKLLDSEGNETNVVSLLGGGFPVKVDTPRKGLYKKTILIEDDDGMVYNLADLLKNSGSGGGGGGANGYNGWSPILSVVADSERRVLQVGDWIGGTGMKPTTGQYIGTTGLTDYINLAIDIRGAVGSPGTDGNDATINGVNVLEIVNGENTTVEIDGNQLKINASSEIAEMLTIKRI